MPRELGRLSTTDMTTTLSDAEARPGDELVLTIAGAIPPLLTRGKVLRFEVAGDAGWRPVGSLVGGHQWVPVGSPPIFMTMEGYPANAPMHFEVPELPPGEYRIRLDASGPADDDGDILDRTATFHVVLRVLAPN